MTWAQKHSPLRHVLNLMSFTSERLWSLCQGGFLCFDSFKPVSMTCQAACLIETGICFLDIFLVLEFPLPSVYFFSSNLCESSFVTRRKKERKHLPLRSQICKELSPETRWWTSYLVFDPLASSGGPLGSGFPGPRWTESEAETGKLTGHRVRTDRAGCMPISLPSRGWRRREGELVHWFIRSSIHMVFTVHFLRAGSVPGPEAVLAPSKLLD